MSLGTDAIRCPTHNPRREMPVFNLAEGRVEGGAEGPAERGSGAGGPGRCRMSGTDPMPLMQ